MKGIISAENEKIAPESMLPPGYSMRPARREDLGEAVWVVNQVHQELLGTDRFSVDELGRYWEMPGFNLEEDSRIVFAPDGRAAAYFDLFDMDPPHVRIHCYGDVHPAHTGKGIASAMLAWAEERARRSIAKAPEGARVVLISPAFTINRKADRALVGRGFSLIRYALRMAIDLDGELPVPEWPEGIALRTLVLGQDDAALIRATREAFADHWGHVEVPFESELARKQHFWATDPDFDPELDFLAIDGGEIAGFSLCNQQMEEDPEMGWVASLAVRRPWRRQGLGLALLLHSLHALQKRGKTRAGLGVDAQNLTGATRLYEKAGMRPKPEWQWSIYEKELRPGVELSTQTAES